MSEIVQDLLDQKKKTKELTKVIFGQIAVFLLMSSIVFAVVVLAMQVNQATWIKNRTLLDKETQKPVRAASVGNVKGLMHVATLPTEAFSHLKTVTVAFSMNGQLHPSCCRSTIKNVPS